MSRLTQFALLLVFAGSLTATSVPAQTTKTDHPKQAPSNKQKHSAGKKAAAKAKLEDVLPDPAAEPPPPPPTPEHMPAVAPSVTYQAGLLTIVARNSVLSDILREVRAKTGANIDIPPGANERVVTQVGPGPARDVLAKLLNGTHFNYVMLGTTTNPNTLAQVILTPNRGGAETGPVQSAAQPGMPMQPGQPYANQPYPGQPNGQPNPNQPYPNQPYPQQSMQVQNPGEQGGGEVVDQDAQDNGDNTPDQDADQQANGSDENQANPNQPQVKTPEQLLQELQRQQQMQQQQQQGQQGDQQPQPQSQPQPQPQIVYPPNQQVPPQQQPQQQQQQEEPR